MSDPSLPPALRDAAVALYDDFTHRHHDRRTLLRRMTALAGSVVVAEALIAGIAATPAAAALVDPADARLTTHKGSYPIGDGRTMAGYFATPKAPSRRGAVMVIHENRGLNAHVEDVARRCALAGFSVLAPDFLSLAGGTPADENAAREMIGKLDLAATVAAAGATVAHLAKQRGGTGKVGVVGFCWGGALVNRVAVADPPGLAAAVSYYGPAPDPAEAAKVHVPLMLHYAGKDARVAQTGEPWVAALKNAGKPVEVFTYPGVDHAFNNDTSAKRYNKAAADLAWRRTIELFHRTLDA